MTEKSQKIRRVLIVEKMIMMPAKAALLIFVFLFIGAPEQEFRLVTKKFFFYQSSLYAIANLIFYLVLTWAESRNWSSTAIKTSAFFLSIIDNLYLSFLIPLTGGLESPLYWLYSGLMIRNALNFPRIREQGLINLAFCIFYGGVIYFSERESDLFSEEIFYLKIMVLLLVSICCWGIYAMVKQRSLRIQDEQELQLRRQKIHAIRRLVGEIAHGLKNPLSIINNAAYYLEKHLPEDENFKNQLGVIREEVEKSDAILSDLMSYSKLSMVKLVKLSINHVLEDVLEELHLNVTFPQIKIKKNFERHLPAIFFDEGHLRQIFLNLLTNAVEAIKAKNVVGSIILSTHLDENNSIVISISDDGIGMTPKEANRIYEPFFTTKEKGTGLGLPIVKNLIETYDGSIHLRSELGKGSTFTVQLPLQTIVENK